MAVTIDATQFSGPSSASVTHWNAADGAPSFGIGGSANALVISVIFVGAAAGTSSGVTVTWNGVSMVSLVTNPSNGGDIFHFGLRNPTTGAFVASVSWTGANQVELSYSSYIGADTSSDANCFKNRTTNTGSATPTSIAITNSSGDIAVAGHVVTGNFSTQGNTDIGHNNTGNVNSGAGNYDTSANPTLTYSFSSGSTWASVGCSVSAGAAAASGTYAYNFGGRCAVH